MADLVVQSKVKDMIREEGKSTSGDFIEKLDEKVRALVKDAIERAGGNSRATVMGRDL